MITEDLELIEQALKAARLISYTPYPKQQEFHALGRTHDERALIAGNQVGKTMCACAEDAYHLTGDYPKWWTGHRFTHPIQAWIAGPNAEKNRDVMQLQLYGPWNKPAEFGTGYLPRDAIIGRPSLARGVTGAYDTGTVRWKDKNGRLDESALSTQTFKAYTEGQLAFASDTIDLYHGDEESGLDIYVEARTRIQVKRGISYITLTPLLGWTDLVTRMLREEAPGRASVQMGVYDALHYTKERADELIAGFPPHLRDAKAYGDPAIGEGKVFLVPEAQWTIDRFPISPHLAKIWGIDFGGAGSGSHPFGAALLAWDRDLDILYLVHSLKMRGMTRFQHIPSIRQIAALPPVAWPHDGNEVREGVGPTTTLAAQYRSPMPGMLGLNMLPMHSTWPEGGFSTAAAVDELDDRMQTGRFLAFNDQTDFLEEVRQYHREKGLLVKVNDDILSAVYKALMMKRYAKSGPLGDDPTGRIKQRQRSTPILDIDPFTGAAIRRGAHTDDNPWE